MNLVSIGYVKSHGNKGKVKVHPVKELGQSLFEGIITQNQCHLNGKDIKIVDYSFYKGQACLTIDGFEKQHAEECDNMNLFTNRNTIGDVILCSDLIGLKILKTSFFGLIKQKIGVVCNTFVLGGVVFIQLEGEDNPIQLIKQDFIGINLKKGYMLFNR